MNSMLHSQFIYWYIVSNLVISILYCAMGVKNILRHYGSLRSVISLVVFLCVTSVVPIYLIFGYRFLRTFFSRRAARATAQRINVSIGKNISGKET